jgi:hypothetical protein
MKKTLLTLSLVAATAAAFGQGKIQFSNAGRPLTLGPASSLKPADASWANQAVPTLGGSGVNLPSGTLFNVALYVGQTAGSETLLTTVPLSSVGSPDDGLFAALNITLGAGFPAGTQAFFQVYAYDASFANQGLANAAGAYWGTSGEFHMTPGSANVNIATGGGSTWAAGPMAVQLVPEPTTMALAGLSAAALLIFRRRK